MGIMKEYLLQSIEENVAKVESLRQEFPGVVNTKDRLLAVLESSVAAVVMPKNREAFILDSAITIAAIHALKILLREDAVTYARLMELIDQDFAGFKTYAEQRATQLATMHTGGGNG